MPCDQQVYPRLRAYVGDAEYDRFRAELPDWGVPNTSSLDNYCVSILMLLSEERGLPTFLLVGNFKHFQSARCHSVKQQLVLWCTCAPSRWYFLAVGCVSTSTAIQQGHGGATYSSMPKPAACP